MMAAAKDIFSFLRYARLSFKEF